MIHGLVECYDTRAVRFLLRWPDLLEQLDAEHVPDAAGRCPVCPGPEEGGPAAVCLVRPVIETAKRVRSAAVSGKPLRGGAAVEDPPIEESSAAHVPHGGYRRGVKSSIENLVGVRARAAGRRQVTGAAYPNPIGRRLRQIRAWRGLSLRAVAELAGFSATYLSAIETGQRPLERLSTIAALADALRVAPSELLDEFPGGDLVRFLLDHPAALQAVRAEHRGDGAGRCRACPPAQSGSREYPCYVRAAAEQAVRLRGRETAS